MAELSETQLAWLHSEVGTRLTDEQLQERYDRLGSVRDVALEALRERRTELIDSPLDVSVVGVASVNNAENVKAIERRLSALAQMDDDPTDGNDDPIVEGGSSLAEMQVVQLRRSRGR
jgi:hypothetical protein